jgi:hypothetical protein
MPVYAPSTNSVDHLVPRVHHLIADHLAKCSSDRKPLAEAVSKSVALGNVDSDAVALPMMVFGAITGDSEGSIPVAAANALWLLASTMFDDLARRDVDATTRCGPSDRTTAQECGYCLPLRILENLDSSEELRRGVIGDFLTGWCNYNENAQPNGGTHFSRFSLDAYRPALRSCYAMAATMSARLSGATPSCITQWAEFGDVLGVLRQLRRDLHQLVDDRSSTNALDEYLTRNLFESSAPRRRRELADLLDAATDCTHSADAMRALVLSPDNLASITEWTDPLPSTACALLTELAPPGPFVDELAALASTPIEPHRA